MALESEDLSAPCKDKLGMGREYFGISHLGLWGSAISCTEHMGQGRFYTVEN